MSVFLPADVSWLLQFGCGFQFCVLLANVPHKRFSQIQSSRAAKDPDVSEDVSRGWHSE